MSSEVTPNKPDTAFKIKQAYTNIHVSFRFKKYNLSV